MTWPNDRRDTARNTLALYAMLGRTIEERSKLDRAIKATSTNPDEWPNQSIPVALWTADIGKQLVDVIPGVIQATGQRPAQVVSDLLMYTLRYGVEIGRNWPKEDQYA